MKILAVDDSPFVRDLLPKLLSQTEFSVEVADGAQSALELLSQGGQEYDCFILDIEMPGIDGIDLCSRIRGISQYSETPIIMLTARTDADSIERAFSAGANDYIVKSSSAKEFVNRIRIAERLLQRDDAISVSPYADDGKTNTHPFVKGHHHFDLSDNLLIQGNVSIISPFSLGNYVSQLPQEDLNDTKVFCVQIEDIERHYEENTTPDFASIIGSVADGISSAVNSTRLLLSYSGDGSFICVARGISVPAPIKLKYEIERHLLLTATSIRIAALNLAQVNVGEPIVPYAKRSQRVRRSFDRAIARVRRCGSMGPKWAVATHLEGQGVH